MWKLGKEIPNFHKSLNQNNWVSQFCLVDTLPFFIRRFSQPWPLTKHDKIFCSSFYSLCFLHGNRNCNIITITCFWHDILLIILNLFTHRVFTDRAWWACGSRWASWPLCGSGSPRWESCRRAMNWRSETRQTAAGKLVQCAPRPDTSPFNTSHTRYNDANKQHNPWTTASRVNSESVDKWKCFSMWSEDEWQIKLSLYYS